MINPVKTEHLRNIVDEFINALCDFTLSLDPSERDRLGLYYGDARNHARDLIDRLNQDGYPDMPKPPECVRAPVAPAPVAPAPDKPLESFRRFAALRMLERIHERYGIAEDVRHAVALANALVNELRTASNGEGGAK